MDRRIRKTREAISEAFIALLAEKSFEQITINEIADRADINRGTIYLHYIDKFDLLEQCIETHVAQLRENCFDNDNAHIPSKYAMLNAFQYLEQHAAIYTTLLVNKGIPAFRNRLMTVVLHTLDANFEAGYIKQEINKEVQKQFLASAIVGVLEWWVTQAMPYPAADMVEQLWPLLERISIIPQTKIQVG